MSCGLKLARLLIMFTLFVSDSTEFAFTRVYVLFEIVEDIMCSLTRSFSRPAT